jgi:protease-4
MGLIDAVNAIRAAAKDSRVKGIYLVDDGAEVSWASLEELRGAIDDFRSSGKPVVSYATAYSQGGYYLCSVADTVCLHPSGMLEFRGLGGDMMYYKELLDKLGVEMQLIRPKSCAYKSAGEVYTMSRMSDANREQTRAYLSSVWQVALENIAESRHLEVSELNAVADKLSGFLAEDAEDAGLVDLLLFEEDVRSLLTEERFGGCQLLPVEKYAKNVKAAAPRDGDAIAVIYAEGEVVDGSAKGVETGVYGDDIVKALKQASKDDAVKAIVLRVNSPGGQATASESMTHAVLMARQKKPVIVSMGDLAASAGYEMSCQADVIVAQPMTITGSIGVFGMWPNAGKLLRQKLGVNPDTVGTNRNATGMSYFRPLSPAAMAMMERNVEEFYKVFVQRVADGRHMEYDDVHEIARGRVWTGVEAKRLGLVDTLGGLDLAVHIAAEKAGLSDYRIKEFPLEKDVWTQLMEMMGESTDDDLNLMAKIQLARRWKEEKGKMKVLSRLERELLFVAEQEGVMARLPFVILSTP